MRGGIKVRRTSKQFGQYVFCDLVDCGTAGICIALQQHRAALTFQCGKSNRQTAMLLCCSNGSVDPPQIHIRANYKGMTVVESIPCGDVLRRWLIS